MREEALEGRRVGKVRIDGEEIVRTGTAPWQIADTKATITVNNARLTKATLLDVNGYAAGDVPAATSGGKLTLKLPPNAMYVVLR